MTSLNNLIAEKINSLYIENIFYFDMEVLNQTKKSFSLFLTAMFLSTAASMNSLAADSNDVSSHADLSNIQNDLSVYQVLSRSIGSLGNKMQHLEKRFSDMGYTVTLQPYTNDQGLTGMNVIAVKEAADPNADIFISSAHHSSVPTCIWCKR